METRTTFVLVSIASALSCTSPADLSGRWSVRFDLADSAWTSGLPSPVDGTLCFVRHKAAHRMWDWSDKMTHLGTYDFDLASIGVERATAEQLERFTRGKLLVGRRAPDSIEIVLAPAQELYVQLLGRDSAGSVVGTVDELGLPRFGRFTMTPLPRGPCPYPAFIDSIGRRRAA